MRRTIRVPDTACHGKPAATSRRKWIISPGLSLCLGWIFLAFGTTGAAQPEIPVTWYGGAGEVSGSLAVVRAGDVRIVLDCGALYPADGEDPADANERAEPPLPGEAVRADALLLTHAHLDH